MNERGRHKPVWVDVLVALIGAAGLIIAAWISQDKGQTPNLPSEVILPATNTGINIESSQPIQAAATSTVLPLSSPFSQPPTKILISPTALPARLDITGAQASSAADNSHIAQNIIDGNLDTWWWSAGGQEGEWIELILSEPKEVTGLNFSNLVLKNITLVFSDGSTQRLALERLGGWQYRDVTPITTSSIRIVVDSIDDMGGTGVYLYEVEVYGR